MVAQIATVKPKIVAAFKTYLADRYDDSADPSKKYRRFSPRGVVPAGQQTENVSQAAGLPVS